MAKAAPAQFTGDDELDSIQITNKPGASAPPTAANRQPTTTASIVTTPTLADDISFDDPDISEAVKPADGLPMIKIAKDQTARFAFVPNLKMKKARVHYLDGTGSIVCGSTKESQAACCLKSDKPATDKFVALVYRYTNTDTKTGKFLPGATQPTVEVQAVRLSRSNMRDCLDSCEDGQSVYDLDFRMRHDDSRAFGYRFSKASSKNAWRALPAEALPDVGAYADGVKLASRLGKKLNAVELNAAFSSGKAEASLADLADLDE